MLAEIWLMIKRQPDYIATYHTKMIKPKPDKDYKIIIEKINQHTRQKNYSPLNPKPSKLKQRTRQSQLPWMELK